MSATQQLIVFIEELFGDDESHKSALSALTAELTADETEMNELKNEVASLTAQVSSLQASVTALGAPVDLSPLTARVTALEARNASDDAAAGAAPNPDAPPVSVITFSPATLPDPIVGQPYSASIAASGSTALPFAFSIASGALPDGLSLGAGGGITGTPGTIGTFDVAIQAHDANGDVGSVSYAIEVDAAAPPVTSSLSGVSSSLSGASLSSSASVTSSLSGVSSSLSSASTSLSQVSTVGS